MPPAAALAALAAGAPALLIAAHPDDETIGLGGALAHWPGLSILHVTDGAPRNGDDATQHGFADWRDYALARRRELVAALRLAGVDASRLHCLHCADQQVAFRMAAIAGQIATLMRERRPDIVITHSYEGGHPDHDATAFAVHAALASRPGAQIFEMTGYHAGAAGLVAGSFLPANHAPIALPLAAACLARKRAMLGCFASQQATLRLFPIGATEWLRQAPTYDFRQPPHPGTLFYERFRWGMCGERFRALATQALGSRV